MTPIGLGSLPLQERARVDPADLARDFQRAPVEEDGLLIFRDELLDDGWHLGIGPALFGAERPPRVLFSSFENRGRKVADVAFVDIETCGLGDDPVFLVGILRAEGGAWELVQLLAPDPSCEGILLRRAAELLASRTEWVSFNGRSFDLPRLRGRARRHCVEWPSAPLHLDLLHSVRRRFRGDLPDCRLGTVERLVLGLERAPGDVPGREAPFRYHDFVETGSGRWLEPVIEHNRRDVAALAVLFAVLLDLEAP